MQSDARYRVSLDPAELQLEFIHGFLTTSYRSPGIAVDRVAKAIRHSLTVGSPERLMQIFRPWGCSRRISRDAGRSPGSRPPGPPRSG